MKDSVTADVFVNVRVGEMVQRKPFHQEMMAMEGEVTESRCGRQLSGEA